ncbi:O-Antigen ligase family protein [Paraburkholderia fungorum]|uniref:O-Antigen ligase family protein n=1 Tax=Paraburkholderia fungorum TaxID=134537 RepID=A0AAU8T4U7_9BURK|nr:O-antigen ligase [Paraburkholderia fungorum]AJZ58777.1 O-Antigen ligase family protein [Paraburkholderia fungorum]USU17257.1 O-antigen ligase family protein [Paraburkholderia fungorum]USU25201.1 O-antigen ligase family protein [Paraburkholderia fungorum]
MSVHPGSLLPALFLLTYPSATLLIHGAGSALSIAAVVISLALLASPKAWTGLPPLQWDRTDFVLCAAMVSPVLVVLLGGVWHGAIVPNEFDSPSRFFATVPLFLVLRRTLPRTLAWADLSFALAGLASLGILLIAPRDWGFGRLSSKFLNPIHFGDIALAMGVLSVLSLNWWRKDRLLVRIIKVAGLFAGLSASLITGSRGGWVAIPVVAAMTLYLRSRGKSRKWKVLLPLAIVAILAGVYVFSPTARDRVGDLSSDVVQYTHGNKDTSLGIRLQLYEAAVRIVASHPLLGLGGDGFRDSMQSFANSGLLTPAAAQLGRGEAHNQMLAYMTDYGLIGGLAVLAIYVVPGVLFWRRLAARTEPARRAALMGLTFIVAFWIFGLTVETFDLKMTVSFYATVIAILAAASAYADRDGAAGSGGQTDRAAASAPRTST